MQSFIQILKPNILLAFLGVKRNGQRPSLLQKILLPRAHPLVMELCKRETFMSEGFLLKKAPLFCKQTPAAGLTAGSSIADECYKLVRRVISIPTWIFWGKRDEWFQILHISFTTSINDQMHICNISKTTVKYVKYQKIWRALMTTKRKHFLWEEKLSW